MRAFRIGAHRVRHDLQNELAALGWLWSDAREASLIAFAAGRARAARGGSHLSLRVGLPPSRLDRNSSLMTKASRKAATPEPDGRAIYQRLAVPTYIIKPQHTWSQSHRD
jgi:hypothetical protein